MTSHPNPEDVLGRKLTGTVKWYDVNRGYGFITGDDGKDYFVHWRGIIREGGPGPEIRKLVKDDRVVFRLRVLKPGHDAEAVAVRQIDKEQPTDFTS